MEKDDKLEEISLNPELCVGCSACVAICHVGAVRLEESAEGFLRPKIDESRCVHCMQCVKVCPSIMPVCFPDSPEIIYAAKHHDASVRTRSTSGGAFTALSDAVLKRNGVVYGAAHDRQMRVVHIRATSAAERDLCCGSKYVKSDIRSVYPLIVDDIRNGKMVLFSGTSCQCAAISNYLNLRGIDREKLVLVDFLCSGTPPAKLLESYYRYLEGKLGKKIVAHRFRDKADGWHSSKNVLYFADGHCSSHSALSQGYMWLFNSGLSLYPSCYHCRFSEGRKPGDITIADFWDIAVDFPDFDDNKGVSIVWPHTALGNEIVAEALQVMEIKRTNIESLKRRSVWKKLDVSTESRKAFWNAYNEGGIKAVLNSYGRCNFMGKCKQLYHRILGQ